MRCAACPARPAACPGEGHPPICGYVRDGRGDWIAHLRRLAEGLPPPPDPGRVDVRLAMLADTCPFGSGPCGCNSSGPPRLCGAPDRPLEVWRPTCLTCVAVAAWQAGAETPG